MLTPETNATTNATAEETNATTEAQMPGGRVKSWTTKDNSFLLGAAAATAGGVGSVAALAVAAATIPPDPPPAIEVNIDGPGGAGGGIDPEILEHAQENAVTIYSVAVDENGEVIMEFGHGSGFFVGGTEGRLIGTAAHVVDSPDIDLPEGATVQTVVRVDGGELEGTLFRVDLPSGPAVDGLNDIAILDIGQTTGYTGIPIAPPGSAGLGQQLWTISVPWDPSLEGTVGNVTVADTDGQRIDGQETEDLLQLHGIVHGGQSGCLVIDSEGQLVGIITHGWVGPFGQDLTITYATKSEEFAELLEQYLASPEFLAQGVSSEVPGAIDMEAFQLWLDSRGEVDIFPIEPLPPTPDDFDGIEPPPYSPDVLILGDDKSGFGPWTSPDSPPDDGGVIDSILEALDALA